MKFVANGGEVDSAMTGITNEQSYVPGGIVGFSLVKSFMSFLKNNFIFCYL